jgi:phage gp36-like protein
MAFIEKEDLTSIIYEEDIDVMTEGDDTKVNSAIAAAIAEAKGYMDRYDHDTLFARTDIDRDPLLVETCKAIACWYLCAACAANQNIKDIRDRANDGRAWLSKVQKATIKPVNWPYKSPAELNTFFHVASFPKRNNNI